MGRRPGDARADLGIEWSFPEKTHSQDALLWEQAVTLAYWDRHELKPRSEFSRTGSRGGRIEQLLAKREPPKQRPWHTVRDAIRDLPDPERAGGNVPSNHIFNPGARSYPGHTGSDYDEPAKVLKAGDHGVPGGENMLLKPNGKVRYFTIRESARLQTFPDRMVFPTSWTESMRQIGNAVPVTLAQVVASHLALALERP